MKPPSETIHPRLAAPAAEKITRLGCQHDLFPGNSSPRETIFSAGRLYQDGHRGDFFGIFDAGANEGQRALENP
jgi:hypothetical protein